MTQNWYRLFKLFTLTMIVCSGLFNSSGRASPKIVDTLEVGTVWAANKVSFALETVGDKQFVAYYDQDRMMTVAFRLLGNDTWEKKTLPNKLHWDSHNYVAMGIDSEGFIHLSGNMHNIPLTYFRSEQPYDIHSVVEVNEMIGGEEEEDVTYPKFFKAKDGSLLYSYRTGSSGNGIVLVNRYINAEKRWVRHVDRPLFDGIVGDSSRSAYHSNTRDQDGNYHFTWIWRWTPMVASSHQICYAVTPDLVTWKNAFGESVSLPFQPDDARVIVDPVPENGGTHNGRLRTIIDSDGNPIIGYIRYDSDGKTQLYLTRPGDGAWETRKVSDWDFRWKFNGGGDQMSSGGNFSFEGLSDEGWIVISYRNETGESGQYVIDPKTLEHVAASPTFSPRYPESMSQRMSNTPGVSVNIQMGKGGGDRRYVLKWESKGKSHGRHAPEVIPEGPLSKLLLLEIE